MTWFSIFNESLALVNATDDRQFHRFTIDSVSASQLAVVLTSDHARPSWHLGGYVSLLTLIDDLPGQLSNTLVLAANQHISINLPTLVEVPIGIRQPFQIQIEIPYWYRQINIQVWKRGTGQDIGEPEVLTVATTGQTTFILAATPIQPEQTELFINGIKARYITEYRIDGNTLNWIASLPLEPSDKVEIVYL